MRRLLDSLEKLSRAFSCAHFERRLYRRQPIRRRRPLPILSVNAEDVTVELLGESPGPANKIPEVAFCHRAFPTASLRVLYKDILSRQVHALKQRTRATHEPQFLFSQQLFQSSSNNLRYIAVVKGNAFPNQCCEAILVVDLFPQEVSEVREFWIIALSADLIGHFQSRFVRDRPFTAVDNRRVVRLREVNRELRHIRCRGSSKRKWEFNLSERR